MRIFLAHNLAHDECTNVTRDPKREHKQLIYNILHKSLNRNFGKYIQFCIEEVVYMCAMRLKARGIYGTYSGTRVPNSEKYVPNENCILLKHKIFPNSVFLYWKIQVILHRKINKRHVTRGVRQVFQLPHILAHVCQKSRNVCQTQIICS